MGECFQDTNKKFICSFFNCKASFSKSWKLEAHLCKHTGLKPFSCERCDKSFCTRYQLTRHQFIHSGDKPYLCSVEGCSESFATNGSLKNHVARVHQNKEKQYVCDYEGCGKEFHKNKQLKDHKCTHANQLHFVCNSEGCQKKFPALSNLKRHEKVHEGYLCVEEGCSFRGKTWTDYQRHRRAEHRANLPCDGCKKVFHEPWFLKKHQELVHSGERRAFRCPKEGCKKTYTTRFNLESHILTFHEGKRPFTCSHVNCNKTFAMEESLQRHAVVHDPQRKKLQKKNQPKRNQSRPVKTGISELVANLKKVTLSEPKPRKPKH